MGDGRSVDCNVGCQNSVKDIFLIGACFIFLWGCLLAFYCALMKAVLDTDESSTALWIYLYSSVLFVIGILLAVRTGQEEMQRQKEKQGKEAKERTVLKFKLGAA